MPQPKNQEEAASVVPSDPQFPDVKPTREMSASEVKDSLAFAPDKELHPSGEPEKDADKTSSPVPSDADVHDPPLRSPDPQTPLVRTLATGAGAHVPPDPEKYTRLGTPRVEGDKL